MTPCSFHVSRHPLVQDKIARLRDKRTPQVEFRRLVTELGMLLGYEAMGGLRLKPETVKTPLANAECMRVANPLVFVTILRAGLSMSDGLTKLEPDARLAHIGIYRNENNLEPVRYYARFPANMQDYSVVVADPMLATGGSASEALNIVKSQGAKNIVFSCIIAAKPGVRKVHQDHPDVPVFAGALDEALNEKGYIVPGLGDAGDRMFGTV
ncbi:MAG: uracil phosphoribosyltransferase [Elusimicrobia bacterium]|nr:uracil phosphoribosyltransferase [Elusimicrobiota bacterium]